MTIRAPNKEEAQRLLVSPEAFRDHSICEGALPPARVFERAFASVDCDWCMPRLLCIVESRQVVGSAGFKSVPRDRRVEIGYNVSPGCTGRGHATQGVRLLVKEAFASGAVEEVFAEVSIANQASRRVLEKVGFKISGTGVADDGPVEFWSIRKEPSPAQARTPPSVTSRARDSFG
jgi:RimJ/RimL family protein N-acetyltransferase